MEVHLRYLSNEPLPLHAGMPEGYNGPILAGSKFYSGTDATGSFVVQEFTTNEYRVRYNLFKFFKKIIIKTVCRNPGLHIRVMLEGRLTHRIQGLGRIHLKQGKLLLVYTDTGSRCQTQMNSETEYHCLDLHFSPQVLEPLLPHYPLLNNLLNGKTSGPVQLTTPGTDAGSEVLTLIQNMLAEPFNLDAGKIYLEEKVQDLLQLLLQKVFGDGRTFNFTDRDLDAIFKARKFIETHYAHHFTIRRIAREAGLNEFKLKTGFRILFSMGVFDCLIQRRMEMAKELVVDSNMSIKEISYTVGYRRLTSFVTAFRKYHGTPPGRMRHNRRL